MNAQAAPGLDTLWAITCYFNPLRYERRLANYHAFRQHMTVPLVAVELSYGEDYQLQADDAEILIRLRSSDVLWQKERLLNVALAALPKDCRSFAWLDCDLLFENAGWSASVCRLLDRFVLVQPFETVNDLGPDANRREANGDSALSPSLAYKVVQGLTTASDLRMTGRGGVQGLAAPGLGWAARRELLDKHGFYDACVLGSGDRAMASAALGRFDDAIAFLNLSQRRAEHYLRWAKPFYEDTRGNIGYAEGTVTHLWHGKLTDRQYLQRHRQFAQFDFDPNLDVVLDHCGCWRWNSDKPAMHQHVKDYFASRREDG